MVNIVITGEFSFAIKTLRTMWEYIFLFMLHVYLEFRLPANKFCNTIIAI